MLYSTIILHESMQLKNIICTRIVFDVYLYYICSNILIPDLNAYLAAIEKIISLIQQYCAKTNTAFPGEYGNRTNSRMHCCCQLFGVTELLQFIYIYSQCTGPIVPSMSPLVTSITNIMSMHA